MDKVILSSLSKIRKIESKQLYEAGVATAPAAGVANPPETFLQKGFRRSGGMKGFGWNAAITGVLAIFSAWEKAQALPKDLPPEQYREEMTKIIAGVVARTGITFAASVFGAIIGGAVGFGVGALPGFVGGLIGGVFADLALGDSVEEIVNEVVAYLYKQQGAVPAAKPAVQQPQATQLKVPPGGDPKVFALQQKLISKGAKIAHDGKMGPQTRTAMKQFPGVTMAESKLKENNMSESEKIAALTARLSQIESRQLNEAGSELVKKSVGSIINRGTQAVTRPGTAMAQRPMPMPGGGVKNMGPAIEVPRTALPAPARPAAPTAPTKPGMSKGTKLGLGATGIVGGAAMLGGDDKEQGGGTPSVGGGRSAGIGGPTAAELAQYAKQQSKPGKPAAGGAASPQQPAPVSTPLNPDEEQELALLANELEKEMGRVPDLDALLLKHKKLRPGETFPQM